MTSLVWVHPAYPVFMFLQNKTISVCFKHSSCLHKIHFNHKSGQTLTSVHPKISSLQTFASLRLRLLLNNKIRDHRNDQLFHVSYSQQRKYFQRKQVKIFFLIFSYRSLPLILWFYFYIITSPAMKALIALLKDIDYTFLKWYSILVAKILAKTNIYNRRTRKIP